MDKAKLIEKAKVLFGSHGQQKVFYFTSDGQAFFKDWQAANHARETRKDNVVTKIIKEDVENPTEVTKTQSESIGQLQADVEDLNRQQLTALDALNSIPADSPDKAALEQKVDDINNKIEETHQALAASQTPASEAESIEALKAAVQKASDVVAEKELAVQGKSGAALGAATKALNKAKADLAVAQSALDSKSTTAE